MQFQLSVYHIDHFLSYQITTDDKITLHFALKSVPSPNVYAPDTFTVVKQGPEEWTFDKPLDKEFEKAVTRTLKRAKL